MTSLLLLLLLSSPQVVHAEVLPYSTTTAEAIVRSYALKYDVSGDEMWQTTLCENHGLDPAHQSEIINKKGIRENSWGNSQINLYWHPEVTKKQAQDPYFSADFMGRMFSEGKQGQWSCWNQLFGDVPHGTT